MLVTYTRQSPSVIEPDDVVEDSRGRKFTATAYAEELYPNSGEFSVAGISDTGTRRFFDFMAGDYVTVTCHEKDEW